MESTHLIMHPDFKPSNSLVQEQYRYGKRRNDLCIIKIEHNDDTRSRINNLNFPDIPCRLSEPLDMDKVKIKLLYDQILTYLLKLHGSACWVAGYGAQDSVQANVYGTKRSVGLYYLKRSYCLEHRKY